MPQEHQPPPIQELAQAIRAVDKHLPLSSIPPAHPDEIFYVERQVDPETKKEVVLWDDILQAFENAVQVRFKANIVHFLKGKNLSMYVYFVPTIFSLARMLLAITMHLARIRYGD